MIRSANPPCFIWQVSLSSIIKHVIHRLRREALADGLFAESESLAVDAGVSRAGEAAVAFADDPDAAETGVLEDRVEVAERG